MTVEIIVVGVSAGGLRALRTLLGGLPGDLPAPVVVVQHRHKYSDDALMAVLQPCTRLRLVEPDDKQELCAGSVYFAPPDYHLLVARGWFELSIDPPVRCARPSVDALFESAAEAFGGGVLAVVLTGANSDGLEGARTVRNAGGTVIAQDAGEAEAPQRPGAVIKAGLAHHVLPLAEIAPLLIDRCDRGAAE